MKLVVGYLMLIALGVLSIFFSAFAFSTVWNWFVPTAFAGAPALDKSQALGLMLVVSYPIVFSLLSTSVNVALLKRRSDEHEPPRNPYDKLREELGKAVGTNIAIALALVVGYVVHLVNS